MSICRDRPLLALGLLLAFGGCKSTKTSSRPAAEASSYWQPQRLLLSADRYRKLHVEIDAVEGTEPSAEDVAALKLLLTRHCGKIHQVP